MSTGIIDINRIESMIAQLKTAATRQQPGVAGLPQSGKAVERIDFGQALKSSLDQINGLQKKSEQLSQRFALGDQNVNLSDVMITMQKASIATQATIQVRNKLVAAYQDIMNMPI